MADNDSLRSILVVVSDLLQRPQLALNKAAQLAARTRAKVTLLHTYAFPYPVKPDSTVVDARDLLHELHGELMQSLQKLAQPLRRKHVPVECVVVWDFPAHDAIVRYAMKLKPDLIMIDSHRHGRISRWLLANTDWELIRHCPVPLWFVKTATLPAALRAVAAVDPLHAHAKPAALDDSIIARAQSLCAALGGRVQLLHSYPEKIGYSTSVLSEPFRLPLPRALTRAEVARVRSSVLQLATRHRIGTRNAIVVPGDPVQQLPLAARKLRANLMVMGALSRRSARRAFIGNTAEKVIDALECDVVVVKPPGFKSGTPKQGARLLNY